MKIVTAVVNNPTFIIIQYYTLQKYFKGDYEFIVFNDAKDFPDFTNCGNVNIRRQIEEVCNKLNIKCINIPNDHHKTENCAVVRCSDSMNYILDYQKQNADKYLVLDSDMFLICDFDANKYAEYDCSIVLQTRGENHEQKYIWNGIYYFDMTKMKNIELLDWRPFEKSDVGGMMQKWLEKQFGEIPVPNPDEMDASGKNKKCFNTDTVYLIDHLCSCRWDINDLPQHFKSHTKLIDFLQHDLRNENGKYFCEIYDDTFFHYRAGGNWRFEGIQFHEHLSQILLQTLLS